MTLVCGYLFFRIWAPLARYRHAGLAAALAAGMIISMNFRPGLDVDWSWLAFETAHVALL